MRRLGNSTSHLSKAAHLQLLPPPDLPMRSVRPLHKAALYKKDVSDNARQRRCNVVANSVSPSQPVASAIVDYFASDSRPVILFDGVCNLCNGGVNFMLDWDPQGAFRLAALQSPAGRALLQRCGRSPDDISSIVLVEKDRCYIKSEAILRIGARLGTPLPVMAAPAFFVPLRLRDTFYDLIANNRYSFFGKTEACRMTDAGRFRERFIES